MKDLKAALGSNAKPDLTHVRKSFMTYTARAGSFGNVKYERANYMRPTGGAAHDVPTGEDFERLRAYLRAAVSHVVECLDSMERHQSTDPQLLDVEGMKRAAFAVDTDRTPGAKFEGPSLLPHLSPACASLMMAIQQAVDCGLLPADPGPTWEAPAEPAIQWRGPTNNVAGGGINPYGGNVAVQHWNIPLTADFGEGGVK